MRPHQDLCPVLGPPVQEGCGETGEGPAEAVKSLGALGGLEHSACEGREPGLGSLVKRRQRGHLPGACDCLKGSYRHECAKLLQCQTTQRGTTATDCSLGGSHTRKASPPGGWCLLGHVPREAGISTLGGFLHSAGKLPIPSSRDLPLFVYESPS